MYLSTQSKSENSNKSQLRKALNLLLLLLLLFTIHACSEKDCILSPNDCDNTIKGSGHMVTDTLSFTNFHSIHLITAGLVNVRLGSQQSVTMTVDDNIKQYIKVNVTDNRLVISNESNTNLSDYNLIFEVTITDIEDFVTSSAGNIVGKNLFTADVVRLVTNSAGNISLDLEAQQLYSMINSAGNISLSGNVSYHQSMINSAGNLNAFSLETDTTTISLNSAGNGQIFVNDLLNATLTSAGSLYYKGNPVIHSSVSSLGKIVNAN